MRRMILSCCLAFLCASPLCADTAPSAAEVLAKVRQATGYAKFKGMSRGLLLRGTTKHLGLEGEYEFLCNAQGHFVRTLKHRLGETCGFDGKLCWLTEQGQTSRVLESEDREAALAVAWVQFGHWLAEPSPFEIAVAKDGATDQAVMLQLRLKGGLFKADLAVNRATWLPVKLDRLHPVSRTTWSFADYHEALGLNLPHTVVQERAKLANSTLLRSVGEAPTYIRSPYALPPVQAKDVTFDPALPAEVKVERLRSGHFLVQPRVNGEDIGWFIFDSGAGAMVIDKTAADKMGMEVFGEVPVVGVGGVVPGRFRQGTSFQLGPMTLEEPYFVEIDLDMISLAMGRKIAGICGAPIFKRAVVELDSKPPRLALYDPAKYKLESGNWQELTLKSNLPCARAKFEGDREGLFRLDTGAGGTVTFHAPAVQTWKLLDGRQTRIGMSGGVGGMQVERTGQLDWFELGDHRFEKPRVGFSQAKGGALADEYLAGNIGTAFLEPFRLVFDYPQKRIALVKKEAK